MELAESVPSMRETVVRYRGLTCNFEISINGVSITPNNPKEASSLTCCCRTSVGVELPRGRVIGAECISHTVFRIFSTETVRNSSPSQPFRYRLRSTHPIDCGVGNAQRVVQNIRRWALNDEMQNETERRIFCLINPSSGKGKATKIFKNEVQPFIRNVLRWKCDAETTLHGGHGAEIMGRVALSDYELIMVMGGDGTIHEALQGLLNREDWKHCVRVPFLPIPVGSGNALATSIGITDIDTALCTLSKRSVRDLDVLSFTQNGKKLFGFLGLMYGALASGDIESESLRCLGDFRFTLGAIREVFRMQSFRIKFAYLPYADSSSVNTHPRDEKHAPGSSSRMNPSCSHDRDGIEEEVHELSTPPESLKTSTIGSDVVEWFAGCKEDGNGPRDWVMTQSYDTRMMAVLNLPYISQNCRFMPEAQLSDGALHLLQVPSQSANRCQLMKIFLKAETGEHMALQSVDYKKIKAFLFEPAVDKSWLTVDGEVVPTAPISIEILPQLLKVASPTFQV